MKATSLVYIALQIAYQSKDVMCYSPSMRFRSSTFVPSVQAVCSTSKSANSSHRINTSKSYLDMKKGKSNLPIDMRGNEKKMKQMNSMREQMMEASTPGADGMPVFNLFVRSKRANVWYPAGSFKGDEKSATLAKSYSDDGFMSGMSKNQLDSGVEGSLYQDLNKLIGSITRTYPQLMKSRNELEFGYKLAYTGLSEDKCKMNLVEPQQRKGFLDNFKGMFGN